MPKLNTYIEVGFCCGYGDGDYRVSAKVQDMSREEFNELRLAILGALYCAEEMWRRELERKPESTLKMAATSASPKVD